jgi:hypothetical protein
VDVLIQDRNLGKPGDKLTEYNDIVEPFLADGPVTRRLAVIDFDPVTNALLAPLKLIPPQQPTNTKLYRYEGYDTSDMTSRAFLALEGHLEVIAAQCGVIVRRKRTGRSADAVHRARRSGGQRVRQVVFPGSLFDVCCPCERTLPLCVPSSPLRPIASSPIGDHRCKSTSTLRSTRQ